mmetsp:Transcript_6290/g.9674  ORF Transcript_6290/g.9674 Transcript_6290/m.9674 type:complete len:226 (+) Transcript_6290:64-741(+)
MSSCCSHFAYSSVTWMTLHFGNRLQIPLPESVSPTTTPVTLHTLFASWAGMQFGPSAASTGAMLHALTWCLLHSSLVLLEATSEEDKKNKQSSNRRKPQSQILKYLSFATRGKKVCVPLAMGYILGLIPCATISGILVTSKESRTNSRILRFYPIIGTGIAQIATLLVGSVWISVFEHKDTKRLRIFPTIAWQRDFIPFLPGLVVKSILSWALFDFTQRYEVFRM